MRRRTEKIPREDAAERPLSEAFEERKKLALSSIVYIRFEGDGAAAHVPEGIDPSIPYPVQLQSPVINSIPRPSRPKAC